MCVRTAVWSRSLSIESWRTWNVTGVNTRPSRGLKNPDSESLGRFLRGLVFGCERKPEALRQLYIRRIVRTPLVNSGSIENGAEYLVQSINVHLDGEPLQILQEF